jgi:hypothetical protein
MLHAAHVLVIRTVAQLLGLVPSVLGAQLLMRGIQLVSARQDMRLMVSFQPAIGITGNAVVALISIEDAHLSTM